MAESRGDKRYRRLFETAQDGILILDFADGRIMDANPFILRLLGYARRELVGKRLWEIGLIRDREAAEHAMIALKRDGYLRYDDLDLQARDGSRLEVEFVSNAYQVDGQRVIQCNIRDISDRKIIERRLAEIEGAATRSLQATVKALVRMLEARDDYTAGHMERVSELSVRIAHRLGLTADAVEAVRVAALLHDIGKNALPLELLAQATPLTPPQRRQLQGHVAISLRVLQEIAFPWPVLETIAQHHERLDGSGYPQGLADGAIRQGARILAVADTIEAMMHARPYRPALPLTEVEAYLTAGRGRTFDAAVVDAGLAMLREGT